MIGKIISAPLRVVNAPIRVAERMADDAMQFMFDEPSRKEDTHRSISKPLDYLANEVEDAIDERD